jgi:hypothetical protein
MGRDEVTGRLLVLVWLLLLRRQFRFIQRAGDRWARCELGILSQLLSVSFFKPLPLPQSFFKRPC